MVLRLRAALEEAVAEFLEVGRHDEDVDERFADERVGALPDGGGALHVDIDEDVDAFAEVIDDGLADGAVVVVVDARVFEEVAGRDAVLEFGEVHEMVILAVDLAGAGRAGRAGDGVEGVGRLPQRTANGRFAGAGRSGDDEENAEAFHNGEGGGRRLET